MSGRCLLGMACMFLPACTSSSVPTLGRTPSFDQTLAVVSRLQFEDSVSVTGVISDNECGLIMAEGRRGILLNINKRGNLTKTKEIPGSPRALRLQRGVDGKITVWSSRSGFVGVVLQDLSVSVQSIPEHPWKGGLFGSPLWNGSGIALALFGEGSPSLKTPQHWTPTPLVYLLDRTGAKSDSLGMVPRLDGNYLGAFSARSAMGLHGDTIVLLNLLEGEVTKWLPGAGLVQHWYMSRYFEAPQPREILTQYPWVDNGEAILRHVIALPQVEIAAIDTDGNVYAVRPYKAAWESAGPRHSRDDGRWKTVSRGLEVYSSNGTLLGKYLLPFDEELRWLRAETSGRIFLRTESQVVVGRVSTAKESCAPLPSRLIVRTIGHHLHVAVP